MEAEVSKLGLGGLLIASCSFKVEVTDYLNEAVAYFFGNWACTGLGNLVRVTLGWVKRALPDFCFSGSSTAIKGQGRSKIPWRQPSDNLLFLCFCLPGVESVVWDEWSPYSYVRGFPRRSLLALFRGVGGEAGVTRRVDYD